MYYNTTGFLGIQARGENFTTALPFHKKHLTSTAKRAKVHKNSKEKEAYPHGTVCQLGV
jgi:hypothetical protein